MEEMAKMWSSDEDGSNAAALMDGRREVGVAVVGELTLTAVGAGGGRVRLRLLLARLVLRRGC